MSRLPSFRLVLVAGATAAVLLGFVLAVQPLEPIAAGEPAKVFVDVTEAMGLKGMSGGTAAWGDFDNDGWVDLCVGGQVWRNEKGKRFTKVFEVAGEAIWGDYDNDGFLDLFCYGSGRLFRNLKGARFEEVKILPKLPTTVCLGAAWGDFNGDGFLDLYVGGYEIWPDKEFPDVLLMSEKGERFVETWRQTRILRARGVTAADFDEDGHLDVFVSNYRLQPNLLWKNDGKGKFTDVAPAYGAAGNQKLGAYGHTIGSAWGDLDNDGHLDLFVGNFSHPPDYQDRSQFLRNKGPKHQFHFEDMTKIAKLRWQESYASPTLGDYDNDGLLDLYFTTVYAGDKSVLYRNLGHWKFEEVKESAGITPALTYQAAWADFDNDGHLDLVTGGKLFRNPGTRNHWLKVRLEGAGKVNRAAIGAQVRLRLGDQTLTRQVEGATGQGNQNDLTLHFGLGDHKDPVKLEIRWTDGARQELETPVDRTITIKRTEAGASTKANDHSEQLGRKHEPGLVFAVRTWEGDYFSKDIPGGVEMPPVVGAIYTINADGVGTTKIVQLGKNTDFPTFSPDGKWVYFQSNTTGRSQVYRCRPDGSGVVNLTEGDKLGKQWKDAYGYALSRDGSKLLYTVHDGSSGRVVLAGPDGSDPRLLFPKLGYAYMGALSPTGDRIVVSGPARGYRLLIADLPDGEPRDLTPDHPESFAPQFTPDGKTIVFIRRDGDIYRVDADGKNLRRLTNGNGYVEFKLSAQDRHGSTDGPHVSPDGKRIAYIAVKAGVPNVCVMNVDGSGHTQITTRKTACGRVRWSPDSTQVAFVSFEGKHSQLFTVTANGGEPRQLTRMDGAVYFVQWRP